MKQVNFSFLFRMTSFCPKLGKLFRVMVCEKITLILGLGMKWGLIEKQVYLWVSSS